MPLSDSPPSDLDALSKLKFVSLAPGARPATASMTQETRAYFKISDCCFRASCKEEQGCSFRNERMNEIGFRPKGRNQAEAKEKKRTREEEQTAKREERHEHARHTHNSRAPTRLW
mmetsp:Transcript_24546/g.52185  ORF Transcript_24546/g.52185 Transcript_24546/m.52185 type:complete len:116 (+) Transcript_24546:218-565(+)